MLGLDPIPRMRTKINIHSPPLCDHIHCTAFSMALELHAVTGDGCFYKHSPPTAAGDSWLNSATKIGSGGWASFKFLFFGPQGDLYAVNPMDPLSRAPLQPTLRMTGELVQ